MKLFLVASKDKRVKSIHLTRRAAIEEAADHLMDMVEVTADIEVVSFSIDSGLVDIRLFGATEDKALAGKATE